MRRALLFAMMVVAGAARASADPVVLQTGSAPVVNVVLRSGDVAFKTWNRNAVQVEGAGAQANYLPDRFLAGRIPESIPAWSQTVQTVRGEATLPAETWVLPQLTAGSHDGVAVRGDGDTTVTVPVGTALIIARVNGRSGIALQDYRGTFFFIARAGRIDLRGAGGTAFLQTVRGAISVADSSFDRVRARNAIGPIVFSQCTAGQIEVSSVFGNVVYDDGKFSPGLARFESDRGDVAVGVSGGAQIGAHSSGGHIATEFAGRASVSSRGVDTRAVVGAGGPVVSASSGTGNVLLYDGSLRAHAALGRRSPALRRLFERGAPLRAGTGARRPRRV